MSRLNYNRSRQTNRVINDYSTESFANTMIYERRKPTFKQIKYFKYLAAKARELGNTDIPYGGHPVTREDYFKAIDALKTMIGETPSERSKHFIGGVEGTLDYVEYTL